MRFSKLKEKQNKSSLFEGKLAGKSISKSFNIFYYIYFFLKNNFSLGVF